MLLCIQTSDGNGILQSHKIDEFRVQKEGASFLIAYMFPLSPKASAETAGLSSDCSQIENSKHRLYRMPRWVRQSITLFPISFIITLTQTLIVHIHGRGGGPQKHQALVSNTNMCPPHHRLSVTTFRLYLESCSVFIPECPHGRRLDHGQCATLWEEPCNKLFFLWASPGTMS